MRTHHTGKIAQKQGRWNFANLLFIAVRIVLGGAFVLASAHKILHPGAFAEIIYNYQILPDPLINLTAIILPWLELLLGLCLLVGIWLPGATLLGAFLLIVFEGSLVFNLARGLNVYCGCFSTTSAVSPDVSMGWYILRDGIFLVLALVVGFFVFFKKQHRAERLYPQ